jgi:cytochrome c-type biogenesis protein CcmH
MLRIRHLLLVLLLVFASNLNAAIEELEFASEEEEARYHNLIDEMRCPKCLNANLSGSDAPIAADLRAEIKEQLEEGRSDEEILDFMTARYGDFILYRPRLSTSTVLLWFGPLALLLAGFFIVRRMLAASRASNVDAILSPEEQQRLHVLLKDGKES